MEWYEEEVSALEARMRKLSPPPGLVAFYGSSSMRMWESLEQDFSALGLLNLAFGGSTMEACAWFFERLVAPVRPRAIVCYAGDNDLGDGRTPEDVAASLRKLLVKVDTLCPGIPFTLLGIKPSPARWHFADKIIAANELLCREMSDYEHGHFIAVFAAMLGSDDRPDSSLFLEDGLHVSPGGYLIWKRLLNSHSKEIF
jgi:lysophospholipase L1-like esterase